MSGVNAGQKKAMGDILAAMNRALSDTPTTSVTEGAEPRPNPVQTVPDSDAAKVAAMSEIMSRFREATNTIRDDAHEDDTLMEALQTERTDSGVRISEWEIAVRESDVRAGKFYDITNTTTGNEIATNLRLYEAALLLTQELNRGESITSPMVREILRLEEEFSKNLEDAARYARVAKSASGNKKVIAEARYSDARSKAISAKKQINEVRGR
jgi:hypothetical protein